MINLDRLHTWLNQSNTQTTNNPLYQVILTLIKAAQEFQNEQSAVNASAGGVVTGLEGADFITHSDESALLPNSRQLVAGTNVTFDDTVVNQRTINVATPSSSDDYVVVSDGVPAGPTPIDDGAGNFIYVPYTP